MKSIKKSSNSAKGPDKGKIVSKLHCILLTTLRIWVFKSGVLKKKSFSLSMVRRRISEAQRWQIIGMHTTGMFFKAIGRHMGYHYVIVSRLVRKHTQTNKVKNLPKSGSLRVTSDCDDRTLQRLAGIKLLVK